MKLAHDTLELADKIEAVKAELTNMLEQLSEKVLRDTDGVLSCCAMPPSGYTQLYVENNMDADAMKLIQSDTQPKVKWVDEDRQEICYTFDVDGRYFVVIVDEIARVD